MGLSFLAVLVFDAAMTYAALGTASFVINYANKRWNEAKDNTLKIRRIHASLDNVVDNTSE